MAANPTGYAKLAQGVTRLGKSVVGSFKSLSGATIGIGGATNAAGGAVSRTAQMSNSLLGRTAGAFGRVFNGAGAVIDTFPKTTALLGIGSAGLMVKGHYDRKRDAAVSQMQAQQQMSYMATTNPEEYALLQERMRGSTPGQKSGHADKVVADREAAAQAQI